MKKILKVVVIPFHHEVTGSRFMVIIIFSDGSTSIGLIDDGWYQEKKYIKLNYISDMDWSEIDWIVITHPHADHMAGLAKSVAKGYDGPIYMTYECQKVIKLFLVDAESHQLEEAEKLRKEYPKEAEMFKPQYNINHVEKVCSLIVPLTAGIPTNIHPQIKLTLHKNGHIYGSAMPELNVTDRETIPINLTFSGDYKPYNRLFDTPELSMKLRKNKNSILFTEGLYGTTRSEDIEHVFHKNMIQDISQKKKIFLFLFAQGRYQEILFEETKLQSMGNIPEEYKIYADGKLGIETTQIYDKELRRKEKKKIKPRGLEIVNANNRENVLNYQGPMIVNTTSGMISYGPSIIYVKKFIDDPTAVFYIMGYAAEGTLARKLVEAKYGDEITIDGKKYTLRAQIRVIREFSAHATQDELLEFINEFEYPYFVGINHAEQHVKEAFEKIVLANCPKVKRTSAMNKGFAYNFYANAYGITNKIVKLPDSFFEYIPKSASETRKEEKTSKKKADKIKKNAERRKRKEKKRKSQGHSEEMAKEYIDKKKKTSNDRCKSQQKKGIVDSKFGKGNNNSEKVKDQKRNYIK